LTSSEENDAFSNGTNVNGKEMIYKTFKPIYTEGMDMPDHEIEMASFIGDTSGIYKLPLDENFNEGFIMREWKRLQNTLKKENDPSERMKIIRNYVNFKNGTEKDFGKMSHRYYRSIRVDAPDMEYKKSRTTGKFVRSNRTLSKMMTKGNEFYVSPGIYIIAGCRTIGYQDEPVVKENGSRIRKTTKELFNTNSAYKTAQNMNRKAKTKLNGITKIKIN
jgi:hypothetical protein